MVDDSYDAGWRIPTEISKTVSLVLLKFSFNKFTQGCAMGVYILVAQEETKKIAT